jgi:hypothetical protein
MSENFSYENRFQVLFGHEDFTTLNRKVIDVTLPSLNIGTSIQPTPIKDIFIPGTSLEIGEVNMTFLLDDDYANYKIVLDWINTLRNFKETDLERLVIDIAIVLLNAKYKEVFTITCEDCFPYSISDIFLNQQIEETEPLKFLTTFKVNGLKYE